MEAVRIRFRYVLPIAFGFLSFVLMIWDHENNRIVESMGMDWDMGPPFWPYQAVFLVLITVNLPAFVLSVPILTLLHLHANALFLQYAIGLPLLVAWWWWVGTRIDFGLLGHLHYRNAKALAGFLSVAALGLICVAAWIALGEIHWWMEYGRPDSPFRFPSLLRTVGPVLWCLVLAEGCLIAAPRLFRGEVGPDRITDSISTPLN
jgi:hypothetical protein